VRSMGPYQGKERFLQFLSTIVRNCGFDQLRKDKRSRTIPGADDLPDIASAECTAEDALMLRRRLNEAVARLPHKLRVVVELRYADDLSYEEIAVALNRPLGTVRSRLADAHARLFKMLLARRETP